MATSWKNPLGWLGATSALLAAAGCQYLKGGASVTDPRAGVALTEFIAEDRHYFPPFIQRFFPGSATFTQNFATITQAQSDITLIEVRQLNPGETRNNEANLSWSADGVYLGFEIVADGYRKIMIKDLVGDFTRDLHLMPKGRESSFLDGMVIKSAHSYNAGLRWSRDSTRFAFMSNGGIGEYNIYVGAIGVPEKTIASSPTKDGYATWSPRTNEMAFVSARSGQGDIYLIDLASKALTRLSSSDQVDIFPEWFPDGNSIVYSSGDALDHDLYVVSRDKRHASWSRPRPLTRWPGDDLRPTVSPDGRFVAFYADGGDGALGGSRTWNIHVVPTDGTRTYAAQDLGQMIVAKDVVIDLNTGPTWSPDGRKLFYVKRDPSAMNPIVGYDLFSGRSYVFKTRTRMNRDIQMSKLGVLSFRAQVGAWDRVFLALTNQGLQLQREDRLRTKLHYLAM